MSTVPYRSRFCLGVGAFLCAAAFISGCAPPEKSGGQGESPDEQEEQPDWKTMQCDLVTPLVSYGGKTYSPVQIGDQCWLKENLDVNNKWKKYCYNNVSNYCDTYGGLYTFNVTLTELIAEGSSADICPYGWRVPTREDLEKLEAAVGGDGKKLLAVGEGSGTNASNFSAVLGGSLQDGYFSGKDERAVFWSSTPQNPQNPESSNTAWSMTITAYGTIDWGLVSKNNGFSIRCIRKM